MGWLFCLALALGIAGAAWGQPAKDPEGYEPVSGDMVGKDESIPAARLVGAAYGVIFAAVLVYVASVAARARRVEEEVEALKRKLERKGA